MPMPRLTAARQSQPTRTASFTPCTTPPYRLV